jgi:hypothetical protein
VSSTGLVGRRGRVGLHVAGLAAQVAQPLHRHHDHEVDRGRDDDEVDQRGDRRAHDDLPVADLDPGAPEVRGPADDADQAADEVLGERVDHRAERRPITTAIARSTTLPRRRKSLKPLIMRAA